MATMSEMSNKPPTTHPMISPRDTPPPSSIDVPLRVVQEVSIPKEHPDSDELVTAALEQSPVEYRLLVTCPFEHVFIIEVESDVGTQEPAGYQFNVVGLELLPQVVKTTPSSADDCA